MQHKWCCSGFKGEHSSGLHIINVTYKEIKSCDLLACNKPGCEAPQLSKMQQEPQERNRVEKISQI